MDGLLIQTYGTKRQAFVMQNGELVEWLIEDDEMPQGTIVKGKIEKKVKGMNAYFIDIGTDKKAYLPFSEMKGEATEGQSILVQIKKQPIGTKGAYVTTFLEFPGKYFIYFPYRPYIAVSKKVSSTDRERLERLAKTFLNEPEGGLFRTLAREAADERLQSEYETLKNTFDSLLKKANKMPSPSVVQAGLTVMEKKVQEWIEKGKHPIIVDDTSFYQTLKHMYPEATLEIYKGQASMQSWYQLQKEREKLLSSHVWLQNGGSLVIEKTEALTAIDVNTKKFIGKENMERTAVEANMLAAKTIAKEMRKRNLSGIIIIDFINMKSKEHQRQVHHMLEEEVKKDIVQVKCIGFTPLGLFEVTRKKTQEDVKTIAEKYEADIFLTDLLQTLAYQKEEEEAVYVEVNGEIWDKIKEQHHLFPKKDTFTWIIARKEKQEKPYYIRRFDTKETLLSYVKNKLDFLIWE
ncbi:ribonuclease E/G [Massilibacterium senegalense]|uniref:ribonuclease E/G n=1 Tax=Massilibacterium senegalense TaxID=1632858 RepID=UPI00078634CA|nr:ribonuclease E/G [Massilibacterium senegalense]